MKGGCKPFKSATPIRIGATGFWRFYYGIAEDSAHGTLPHAQNSGNLAVADTACPKFGDTGTVEDFAGASHREVLPGPAVDGLAHLPGPVILLLAQPARLRALPDQGSFKFRSRPGHMEQEPACGMPLIGIEALGDGDKPDAVVLQGADVLQAVHQGAAEAVQLPNQEAIEFPCHGISHKAVQPWSAGLGAADDVLAGVHELPPLAAGIVVDFAKLKVGVLIGG
jgi:hypothetical protein